MQTGVLPPVLSVSKVSSLQQALVGSTANLLAWWDAERDVYSDTGLTTAVADGGTVAGWRDQGASGYHVTQSTAGDRPVYRRSVAAFGGKPAVEFVSSDLLTRTGLSGAIVGNAIPHTAYIIYATSSASLVTMYSEGNSGAATPFVGVNISPPTATFSYRDGVGVIASGGGGSNAANGSVHLVTVRRSAATSWALRFDGSQVVTDTDNVGTISINQVALGCFARTTNSQFFVGHIAQVLLYGADNFATIEPILKSYYGIA